MSEIKSMNSVNKTLYIPLYGKSYVSHRGMLLHDKKAEEIWDKEGFLLKGKSKSKWLAFYMAMRARVFDEWVKTQFALDPQAIVLHIGCGMDSRAQRVDLPDCVWYDIDFAQVIEARKKYFVETENYHMLIGDFREKDWLDAISEKRKAIVVLEGVSMYLSTTELQNALMNLQDQFDEVTILMDCYSEFGAKISKFKNPIREVGVNMVYGLDDPTILEKGGIQFIGARDMTPMYLINELQGLERVLYKRVYAGKIARKIYKLYEFEIKKRCE